MIAQLELKVYRDLVAYLSGKESLSDFRQRFDSASWDQGEWESSLIGQIELALAEFSSGHRTEQELREILQSSSPNVTLELEPLLRPATAPSVTSGASNTLKLIPLAISKILDSRVGRLREAEYA